MKKAFLFLMMAAATAFVSCNGNKQQIGDGDASTEINVADSTERAVDSTEINYKNYPLGEPNYVQWAKDSCGLDLAYDHNTWLPAYFKLVPQGFQYSIYAKDPMENIEQMTRDFIQQCLDVSESHSVGPDPNCTTVDQVLEHHITKQYKNETNPDEGFFYTGEIVYVYNGAKIVAWINFGQYVKSNHATYIIKRL